MSHPHESSHPDTAAPARPSAAEPAADRAAPTLRDDGDPSWPEASHLREARDLLFGRHVGPYHLLALVGEGGMGQVFRARQEAPLRRDVAVKVIKRGMDTDAIVARFASERRALAMMDHPAIARVLDAGTTDDGRPYVVMELVNGTRLTDYCDGQQLDLAARLRLFLDVLRGVQHAHQKGVLHRDLKPSNILVAVVDGRPQPKIIDFGIAKALAGDDPLATLATVAGQFVGTPEYMSPEQAGVMAGGVDTRTDVYSLGVVLFELLTGHRPYGFARRTPTEVAAHLTTPRSPVRPSAAVQTQSLGRPADATEFDRAAARRTSPARLRRTLRGDLDTIVVKAMHPAPDRRYGSVEQFAADVERYLAGQPVLARPDTLAYRTRRFVQRHAIGVGIAAAALLALALFVTMLARERARAVEAERQARIEAQTATQVSDFLVGLFDDADPRTDRGRDVTARELVDRGAERISAELTDTPLVRGQLLTTLGDVYRSLGRAEQAEPLLRESLRVREAALGADHPLVARTLGILARVRLDRGDLDESLQFYTRALAIQTAADGPSSAAVAEVLNNLGLVHLTAGRFTEAVAAFSRAIEIRRAIGTTDNERGGATLYNMAVAHYELGQYGEAAAVLAQAEPLLRAQYEPGTPHPSLVALASFRGLVLRKLDRDDEAQAVLEAGVTDARALYKAPHSQLGTIVNNLALVVQRQGDLDRAEALYREALAIDRAVHGDDHADVAHSVYNLGTFLYRQRGRHDEGIRLVERALAMRQRLLGPEHPHTAAALSTLGDYRAESGRLREAVELYQRAEAIQARVLPADHDQLAETRKALHDVQARLR